MIFEKTYLKPTSIAEAIAMALANKDNFKYIAGGTDVLLNKFQGNDNSSCLIDISGINEMKNVNVIGKHLQVGSLVTLHHLNDHPAIINNFPSLIAAARSVGSPMIRKTATLGGNLLCENRCLFYNQSEWWREAVGNCLKCDGEICIATGGKKNCFSKFISDTAIALISMDACIKVVEYSGGFIAHLEDIYTGDGIQPRKFDPTSLIVSIYLPMKEGFRSVFKKLRQRESIEFSSLSTAVTINKVGKIKIVLGGVDPKPIVVVGTTKDNIPDLIKLATKKARIVDNDVYSREYRKEMIGVYLKKSFIELGMLSEN